MKSISEKGYLISIAVVILTAIMIVLLFVPTINYGAGTSSILGYIGFPNGNNDLSAYLKENIEGFFVNDTIWIPIILLLFGIGGAIITIRKSESTISMIWFFVYGLVGTIGFLVSPFLRLSSLWGLQLALIAIIMVASAVNFFLLRANKPETIH